MPRLDPDKQKKKHETGRLSMTPERKVKSAGGRSRSVMPFGKKDRPVNKNRHKRGGTV